jgi:AdoMet-dependent heme synthase
MTSGRPHPSSAHAARFRALDLDQNPFIVFWEVTRACALSCVHCRARATPKAHPLELDSEECLRVVDSLAEFEQPPLLILSGGDPFMRRDLFDVIRHARSRGLTVAVAPSATALVVEHRIKQLVELGVASISLSLDGADAEAHDSFRGFAGTFERTLGMMELARECGMPFQVNTTVSRRTVAGLPRMAELLKTRGPSTWDLFFLVPTGRAATRDVLSAREHEDVFNWLLDDAASWPFRVKTTLAPHYRRVFVLRKMDAGSLDQVPNEARPLIREGWRGPVTNDGRGTMFISHLGDIYPSGFLPVRTGNVRTANIVETYRQSPVFRSLRDVFALKGKCGDCQFNAVCGGSRARAFAMTGDMLASDPTCAYSPLVV